MRLLLDAGGDVHGFGADHAGDVIGWGTFFTKPGKDIRAVADFLVSRGARHNIFSAISIGDLDVIRAVVKENPVALDSRLSRFEHGVTPLQLAVVKKRDDILALLIDLGADLEAEDIHGQTALSGALALGNREAVRRLQAAGARAPKTISSSELKDAVATLSGSTHKIIPMISVADVAATLDWYVSIGFTESGASQTRASSTGGSCGTAVRKSCSACTAKPVGSRSVSGFTPTRSMRSTTCSRRVNSKRLEQHSMARRSILRWLKSRKTSTTRSTEDGNSVSEI